VKEPQIKPNGSAGVVFPSMLNRPLGAGDEIMIEYESDEQHGSESAFAFVIRTFQHFYYIFELAPIQSLPDRLKARKNWTEILTASDRSSCMTA
jgi:hypothetical protein